MPGTVVPLFTDFTKASGSGAWPQLLQNTPYAKLRNPEMYQAPLQ